MTDCTTISPGWACYVRLSDEDKQRPELSLAAQRRNIQTALLDRSDLSVYRWYEDRLSGRRSDRPDYQQLLADARAGHFSRLAISRADRFGRDVVEALIAVRELLALDITVKLADMPSLDITTPDGFLIATIQLGLAHHESARIGERVKSRMQEKFLSGQWPWKAPDGYRNCEERVGGKYRRWVEPDPDRLPIVRELRQEFVTGKYTISELCDLAHARGYLRGNGDPWVSPGGARAIQAMYRLLTNEFYAGWLVSDTWGMRAQGTHEPVDDEATHARILTILKAHTRGCQRRRNIPYLLPDVLWSAEGDCRFYSTRVKGRHGGEYDYYYTKQPVDGQRLYILCRKVDERIPVLLDDLGLDEDTLPGLRSQYTNHIILALGDRREEREAILKRRIRQLEGEELRLARLLVSGRLSEHAHEQLQAEWKGKLIAARAQLSQIQRDTETYIRDMDDAARMLSRAAQVFRDTNISPKDKKRLVEIITRRIVVNREGEIVHTDLHPPFAYLHALFQKPSACVAPTGTFSNPPDLSLFAFPTQEILTHSPTLLEMLRA